MTEQEKNTTSTTDLSAGSGDQANQASTNSAADRTTAGSVSNAASDNTSKNNATAASAVETVKSTAQDVLAKAKDSAGQAYGFAAEKATSKIEEQKTNLSGSLSGVAESIRQVGKTLGETDQPNAVTDLTSKYGETLAGQIENLSGYFEQKDLGEIVRDVESFARRQPAVFIGAAFVAGLFAARFLKSSGEGSSRQSPKLLPAHSSAAGNSRNKNKSNGQTAVNPS